MRYPLGILCTGGEFLIRDPLRVEADGSIVFVTEIPSNTVATMMIPDIEGDLSREARKTVRTTFAAVAQPKVMLIFDCVSRHYLLGETLERELIQALESVDSTLSLIHI